MKKYDWKRPCWAMDRDIYDADNGVYYDQKVWIAGFNQYGNPIICEEGGYDPVVCNEWDSLELCKTKKK